MTWLDSGILGNGTYPNNPTGFVNTTYEWYCSPWWFRPWESPTYWECWYG